MREQEKKEKGRFFNIAIYARGRPSVRLLGSDMTSSEAEQYTVSRYVSNPCFFLLLILYLLVLATIGKDTIARLIRYTWLRVIGRGTPEDLSLAEHRIGVFSITSSPIFIFPSRMYIIT